MGDYGATDSRWRLERLLAPSALALLIGYGILMMQPPVNDEQAAPEAQLTFAPIPVAKPDGPAFEPKLAAATDSKQIVIGRGDTFIGALTKAGVNEREAHLALAAVRSHFNPRRLQVGQAIDLTFARSSDGKRLLQEVAFEDSIDKRVQARFDAESGWSADLIETPLSRMTMRTGGVISNSLYLSAARQKLPAPVIADLIRIFSYDVDFQREIKEGDSFEVYFERFASADGQKAKEGNILFAKLTLSGKPVSLYRYGKDNADYFHEDGRSVRKTLLRTPVDGARLSSGYGARKHPILGYTKVHKGVDFAAPRGTPIMAAGDGVIERASPYGGYGNYVRIRHTNNYATAYAHMNGFAQGIRAGTRVKQGQIIGYIGSTGRSTGPHLHYEVLLSGVHANPLSLKLPTGTVLQGKELAAFAAFKASLDRDVAAIPLPYEVAMAGSDTQR